MAHNRQGTTLIYKYSEKETMRMKKKRIIFTCPECYATFTFYKKEIKTVPRCEFCKVKLVQVDYL